VPDIDDPFLDEVEPTAAQVGVDVPGSRSGFTDFINFGVFNGNFRVGPPDPSANVDPVGAAGSNFVPGWRFVQSSNTVITAKSILGSKQGAGSNLRLTHDASGTSGTVYLEQIVDVGGSAVGDIGATTRIEYQVQSGSWTLGASRQYLAGDGSIAGMPKEFSATYIATATAAPASLDGDQADDPAPATARYLRYRVTAQSSSANGIVDVFGIRRERAVMYQQLIDSSRTTNGLYDVMVRGSNLLFVPTYAVGFAGYTGTDVHALNHQLIGIPFTVNSIPSNATTDMQPFDNAVAQGTPRISVGWSGWIVGVSYRMTGLPTAGNVQIWATVAGAQTWKAFTVTSTDTAASQTTQPPYTAGMSFAASSGLGIQLVTSAAYTPNGTRNMSAMLWLAVRYDAT
jgi:hypothetical protein